MGVDVEFSDVSPQHKPCYVSDRECRMDHTVRLLQALKRSRVSTNTFHASRLLCTITLVSDTFHECHRFTGPSNARQATHNRFHTGTVALPAFTLKLGCRSSRPICI